MKKKKRRAGVLLAAVLCIPAALSYAGEPLRDQNRIKEKIWRYTELFDSPEEIPAQVEKYENSGIVYRLVDEQLVIVPVTDRTKSISGQTIYRAVSLSDEIPDTAVMKVQDEESGDEFDAVLPLEKTEYGNERWEDGFFFTATFHDYGSDYYSFSGRKIPHQEDKPALSDCEAELLEAIGMRREECLIDDYDWAGGPYEDEEDILCRDVLVSGRRKVWDCTAIYTGMVKLPDYNRYRKRLIYEKVYDGPEGYITPNEVEESDAWTNPANAAQEEGAWERIKRMIIRGMQVSLGIFFIIAAVLAFRFLLKKAKSAGQDEL